MQSITEKMCTRCLEIKPLNDFGKSSRAKDGKRSRCKKCHNADNIKYNIEHPEKRRLNQLKIYAANPEKFNVRSSEWRKANPDKYKESIQKSRIKHKEKRKAEYKQKRKNILEHYGNKCACCGEETYEFLAIDHVNGGGNQERKSITYLNLFKKIIKENYPPSYQILCHNCNLAKGFYGYCPHKNH